MADQFENLQNRNQSIKDSSSLIFTSIQQYLAVEFRYASVSLLMSSLMKALSPPAADFGPVFRTCFLIRTGVTYQVRHLLNVRSLLLVRAFLSASTLRLVEKSLTAVSSLEIFMLKKERELEDIE